MLIISSIVNTKEVPNMLKVQDFEIQLKVLVKP